MASDEYFPRGDTRKHSAGNAENGPKAKKIKLRDSSDDLFGTKTSSATKVKKTKKKQPVPFKFGTKKKQDRKVKKQSASSIPSIETLTTRHVTEGMMLLGCIKRVNDYGLSIGLPNNLTGYVSITDISYGYKALLQRYAESVQEGSAAPDRAAASTDQAAASSLEPHSLDSMFSVGTIVPCKVISAPTTQGARIKLSLNPRDINHYLTVASLKNGTVMYGAISSEEDHGYSVDLGVAGVTAFLPRDKLNKAAYLVGEIVRVALKSPDHLGLVSGENRVVNVTAESKSIAKAEARLLAGFADGSAPWAFRDFVPGMRVTAEIERVTDEGLHVNFAVRSNGTGIKGCVHRSHVSGPLDQTQPKKTQLRCRLLYIDPTSKRCMLTALPHLVDGLDKTVAFPDELQRGLVVDGTVTRVYKNKAVLLQLSHTMPDGSINDFDGGACGYASKQHLKDGELPDGCQDFKRGSKHMCRILDFDLLERKVMVSLKRSVLDQEFLDYTSFASGQNIKVTLRGFHKQGVSVNIGRNLRGFVPFLHLTDVPLKKPQAKFKKGDELKCRVLSVDAARRRVILTAKKSLVAKTCVSLVDYSSAQHGQTFQGVIVKVMVNGCVVVFFNNVKGWVPKSQLSTEPIPYPEKVFYPGQVVKCHVLTCVPGEQRLVLSFKLENVKPFGKHEALAPVDFDIGKVVTCSVVGRTASGLDVTVGPEAVPALLPAHHLSDNLDLIDGLLSTYGYGDEIVAVYFSRISVLTVTAKPCFVSAGRLNTLPKSLDDLKPGNLFPGVVRRILDYGAFIDLGGGLTGLCPNKYLANRRVVHAKDVLQVGQSVYAKVIEVDTAKHRFVVSLRMSDCYHGDTHVGLDLLKQRLIEEERIRSHYASTSKSSLSSSGSDSNDTRARIAGYTVGSVINVRVSDVTEHGMLLTVPDSSVKALATTENTAGCNATAGSEIFAIVAYVDLEHGCLECVVQPNFVKSVKTYCGNKFSQAKPGQVIKGETLLVKSGWQLAILRAHAAGRLAYVPSKRHLNDWDGKAASHHGQVNPLLVRDTYGSLSVCTVQTDEDKKKLSLTKSSRHLPTIGNSVKAEIKSIVEMQMNVSVQLDSISYALPGRVHVTEILDIDGKACEVDLKAPFSKFAVGEVVDAVVIGYREVKVKSSLLPITRPHDDKVLAELSLRPSRFRLIGQSSGDAAVASCDKQINKGDTVAAFVEKVLPDALRVKVTRTKSGIVPWWALSHDSAVIQRLTGSAGAEEIFPIGSGHLATVLDTHKDGTVLLSLTGSDCTVRRDGLTKALVTGASSHLGVCVSLPHGHLGKVPVVELSDGLEHAPWEQYAAGAVLDCTVLACQKKDACILSLRKARRIAKGVRSTAVQKPPLPQWTDPASTASGTLDVSSIQPKSLVRGYVVSASRKGVFVTVGDGLLGRADLMHASSYFVVDPEAAFFKGMCVIARVLSVDSSQNHLDLSFLEADTGRPEPADPIFLGQHRPQNGTRATAAPSAAAHKLPLEQSDLAEMLPTDKHIEMATAGDSGSARKRRRAPDFAASKSAAGAAVQLPAVGFDLDTTLSNLLAEPDDTAADEQSCALPGSGPAPTAIAAPNSRRSADASKPKVAKVRSEAETEAMLYEAEQKLISSDRVLQTADDYERLVLQSPDSSMAWLGYMSHCLGANSSVAAAGANVEAARAVAERALATISYREEQERMNVWSALLNVECLHGSSDSLQAVLSRAVQNMDPLNVYQRLIAIYIASAKVEAAEGIHLMLVKKFSQNKDVWLSCGLFYFRNGKTDSARELMHRSLKSLPKSTHVDVLARFAQMEFRHGSPERGRTLFETLLSTCPKRTDLWSVYIDMSLKHGTDVPQARQLLERAVSQTFPAKVLKLFYRKYVEFEEAHGDAASQASVKKRASLCGASS